MGIAHLSIGEFEKAIIKFKVSYETRENFYNR
jgi:hypothetical protein